MTEEQRKNAMLALGRIVLSIEGLKMDYKQDVQTIIYALQSAQISETQLEYEIEKTAMSETQDALPEFIHVGDFVKFVETESPPVPSDLDDNITITMDSKGRMIMKLK